MERTTEALLLTENFRLQDFIKDQQRKITELELRIEEALTMREMERYRGRAVANDR